MPLRAVDLRFLVSDSRAHQAGQSMRPRGREGRAALRSTSTALLSETILGSGFTQCVVVDISIELLRFTYCESHFLSILRIIRSSIQSGVVYCNRALPKQFFPSQTRFSISTISAYCGVLESLPQGTSCGSQLGRGCFAASQKRLCHMPLRLDIIRSRHGLRTGDHRIPEGLVRKGIRSGKSAYPVYRNRPA
ncbi:hypothetical protein CIHG_00536 [Coccidioides immitis H538.4]|uniref:Uncharacterized protein n=3 Tax=Coccidioides immitis TaxID=5501 RepID=A0A0J8QHF3_COCIT|nr:hypothetical protein CIRG_07350 [Coccidioides immitis RMSCC 2394]KMU71875.1 hypothetical protein CISG_00185 [Coccidioides immitis RMSCC 3703]KMU82754.1 hypothetical protein CIHG_00536 [Coccidioides immitis H538.4]